MKLPECEIDRDAKLTAWEKVCAGLGILSPFIGVFLAGKLVKWLGR